MNSNSNYENKIIDAIEAIVDSAVQNAKYDKTIQAKIINCVDSTIGKYKVQYQDSVFFAYSNNLETRYNDNADVYILIPGNDTSREKTIIGTTKKLGINYISNLTEENAFEIVGNNCVDSANEYSLCSYKKQEIVLYDKENNIDELRLNLTSIDNYIHKSSSIVLGAKFKTKLPSEQQFRGNYGIGYELVFLDNTSNNLVTKNYVLDVNQIEGNPYKLNNYKRQIGIFEIDAVNFQYINKVYLFCYDFPNAAIDKQDDIFIKDLEICGGVASTSEELASCGLVLITPQGTYFDDNDLDSATRALQAQVRVKGKNIDVNSQTLSYYWFRENLGISVSSEKYNSYGGQGWECLNESNLVQAGDEDKNPVVQWVPGTYQYLVKKSASAARETKYKCVVLYNDVVLSKEVIITNYSSNYNITIVSDNGTQFYYDIGNPSLTCLINGENKTSSNFTYQWAEIDNNNNFISLAETTEENDEYNTAVVNYEILKNRIANEQAMPAAAQDELEGYLATIKKYDNIIRVEGNQIHHLQVNEITNFKTYKCAVYYNGIYIGTSSIVINNSLETQDVYSLVINNGAQVFKYNEAGVAPTSSSLENPYILLPLSFTVYDNLGQALDNEVIKHCEIKWIVPTENTMISIPDEYDPDIIDMGDGTKTYSNLLALSYNILEKYRVNKTNNNIKLIVSYKGMNLVAQTDFTFAKEGEPGTNGTEFLCKIVPNVAANIAPLYPTIINGVLNYTPKQSGRWFRVQLWHNGVNIFEGNASGTSTENKSVAVTWSILKNKYSTTVSDITDINLTNAASGIFSYNNYAGANSPANIIKCTIVYDNITYYATMPIITVQAESGYGAELVENTGFRYATYSADGRSPQYDNSTPFTLKISKEIDGIVEDISNFTKENAVNYNWQVRGRIYNPVAAQWVDSIHLSQQTSGVNELDRSQAIFKPIDNFDGECLNNAIECIITNQNNEEVIRIHMPIHLLLNKYGNAAINGWDGNSVSIDKDECGVILAPQMGAGQKEADNSFTGMLMGKTKEAGKNNAEVGLFGYNWGTRTLFLNAEDGSAIFGKAGSGQLIVDPATSKALLYSSNYWKNYKTDGKPSNYSSTNENGQGMLIDLTTPQIKWGNGNFIVDEDGHLTAKGGGDIAGWKIGTDKLYSAAEVSTGHPKITLDSTAAAIYSNDKVSMTSARNGFYIGSDGFALGAYSSTRQHNPFQVTNEGVLYSDSGTIGGWTIGNDTLTAGNITLNANGSISGGSTHEWSISTTGTATFNKLVASTSGTIGGWNIGSDRLTAGDMVIKADGSIRGNHWSISNTGYASFTDIYLSNANTSLSSSTKLIDLGNFSVTAGGTMNATNGNFTGDINTGSKITGSEITGGKINITTGGNGYLRAGLNTTHVDVSGLNVDSYGIHMKGYGISHCSSLSGTTDVAVSSDLRLNLTGKEIYIRATDGMGSLVFLTGDGTGSLSVLSLYSDMSDNFTGSINVPRYDTDSSQVNGYYHIYISNGRIARAEAHNVS